MRYLKKLAYCYCWFNAKFWREEFEEDLEIIEKKIALLQKQRQVITEDTLKTVKLGRFPWWPPFD